MTAAFPQQRFLRGNFAPLRVECDAPDLVIEGELPRELNGTLLRNGPNPMYPPRDNYHMFSGDGMIHAFQFDDGRVSYRNRWVRTAKLERERAAGEALFGTFGNPATSDPTVIGEPYNVANTNVIWHGGRLLALEESNPPVALDPHNLDTQGAYTFDGRLEGPMTAHPKVDPLSGELHFFGYGLGGLGSPTMAYHVADAHGRLTRSVTFESPYPSMVHDFVVTEHYVLFPIFPLTTSLDRARCGQSPLAWEPDKLSYVGIMPRDGEAADITWYEGEACCVFHPMNAFEAGDSISADMLRYDAAPGFAHADGTPADPTKAVARLERWRFDLAGNTNTYTSERLDDFASEYPRFDERRAGRAYQHGYFASTPSELGRAALFNQIVHYDFHAHATERFELPRGDFTSEPVFVPRAAAEGAGYLLAVIFRGAEKRSDVIVLDAENVSAGPLAVARLDTRVPFGFHGNWMPADGSP